MATRSVKNIQFPELITNGTNYVELSAPDNIPASYTLTLPSADGASGSCLQTDGLGGLSFVNTSMFPDNTFEIYDNLNPLSIIKFTADALVGNTRAFSAPNSDGVLPLYHGSATSIALGNVSYAVGSTNNTSIGVDAGIAITTGTDNTLIGHSSGILLSSGVSNTLVGSNSGAALTSGGSNTFLGTSSGAATTLGSTNVAVGASALAANTTGTDNVAIGNNANDANTAGIGNISIGRNSLGALTSGSNNISIGTSSMLITTTSTENIAIGHLAMGAGNVSGSNNTSIGTSSLTALTSGGNNTCLGNSALSTLSTTSNNVAIGRNAGNTTTGSNNIFIGSGVTNAGSNRIQIGTQGTQTSCIIAGISGQVSSAGIAVLINASGVLGTTTSSRRFKNTITPIDREISKKIYSLEPVSFYYNEDYSDEHSSSSSSSEKPPPRIQYGLIAEDVEEIFPEIIARENDSPDGKAYSIQYHLLQPLIIKELQSLRREFDEEIEKLRRELSDLEKRSVYYP